MQWLYRTLLWYLNVTYHCRTIGYSEVPSRLSAQLSSPWFFVFVCNTLTHSHTLFRTLIAWKGYRFAYFTVAILHYNVELRHYFYHLCVLICNILFMIYCLFCSFGLCFALQMKRWFHSCTTILCTVLTKIKYCPISNIHTQNFANSGLI